MRAVSHRLHDCLQAKPGLFCLWLRSDWASQVELVVKNLPAIAGDNRRSPGEQHGNPLQYSCLENPMDRGAILWQSDVKNWLTGKDPEAGKDWRQEEKGMTKDDMVGGHHWHEHEFEQAPGVCDGQGSLGCCSPWVAKIWTRLSDWTD